MADYVVFGRRRAQVVILDVLPGEGDATAATASITDALAAGKAESAWYTTVSGFTAENPSGAGIDVQPAATGVTGDPADLNP